MTIPRFSATASPADIAEALGAAGCVVVTDVASADLRQSIRNELSSHLEKAAVVDDDPKAFYPGQTRRVTGLVARSPVVTSQLMIHPITQGVCETHLKPNSEYGYQLHVTAALEVGPGAREQVLHREEDSFTYFSLPRPSIVVASMWAISDFRKENGATLVVPGSHKWTAERKPEPDEIISAEMPAGSVLFWMGGLLHGAGENTSEEWRYGIILTYSLGWVRQEENQYLDVPSARVAELTPEEKQIAGFNMYDALGFHDPSISPEVSEVN